VSRRALGKAVLGVSAALALAAGAVMLLPTTAGANGPTKYGWWYEANTGLPISPPPPAQVPSDGLYVENGFNGPTAISALTFTVPAGAQIGPMTLKIASNPTITQPPLACTLSASSASYKAAQDGPWTDRPSYDCKKAQITGAVDTAKSTVSFNVDPFLANGTVALVILAGGPADQIAFQKPDDGALQATSGDSGAVTGANTGGGTGAAAVTPDTSSGSNLPALSSPADSSSLPLVDTGSAPLPPVPTAPPGSSTTAPSAQGGSQGPPGYALARPAAAIGPQGWHTKVATGLGLTAVMFALIAWTLGYGPLGGRILPLSVRLRPPSPPSE
jgi:hypothetical protein